MTRKFTFLLMALLALAGFKSWGQTTILSEDFEHEGDFPTGWTATHNTNNGIGWTCTDYNNSIGHGHGGTGYAVFCKGSSSKLTDYLTTSAINFSDYSSATLSFYYINRDWSPDVNEIRVEYSASTSGPWTNLWTCTTSTGSDIDTWTQANVNISSVCGDVIYLRFVDVDKWGYGIAIDDIVITGTSGGTKYNITYDNTIQHGTISGPAQAFAGAPVTLTATPDAMYELDNWTVTNTTTSENIPVVNNQFTMPESNVSVSATFVYHPTLTVNDGTATNNYVPIYGYNVDNVTRSQFIIPASDLDDIVGGMISKLTFYSGIASKDWNASWKVYLKEVSSTTLSAYEDWNSMTEVYDGPLSISDNQMVIDFTSDFQYMGGNLLIGLYQKASGSYVSDVNWKGVSATLGSSLYSYGSNSPSKASFLPKTIIVYTPGAPRYDITTVSDPIEGGTIITNPANKAAEGDIVTLSATANLGYEFVSWSVTDADGGTVTVTDNSFVMPGKAVTVTATFNQATQYAINCATLEGGSIHAEFGGETITQAPEGTVVTLVAVLAPNYALEHFTVDGAQIEGNTFTMPAHAVNVSATFAHLETLTVNEGTETNQYIPIYGYFCDASNQHNQFIIPAEQLAEMLGGTISSMTFYLSSPAPGAWGRTWTVKLMETTETTISSLINVSSATSVYTGVLNGQSSTMEVPFSTPYAYNGGNLLVDFSYSGGSGSYKSASFYGISTTYNSSYYNYNTTSGGPQQFLPKTTFDYVPNPNLHHITVTQPVEGGTISAPASAISGTTVTLTATPELGYEFGEWNITPSVTLIGNTFEMPESDVTVTATFNALAQYGITFVGIDETLITVAATYGGETITEAPAGTEVTLQYSNLDEGYTFINWTLNGEPLAGNTFEMPANDVEIGVVLNERPRYTVTIDGSIAHGTVTASPNENILSGKTVTLTVTPADSYVLNTLTVTDADSNPVAVTNNQFTMPESNVTVTATFSPVLTLTVNDGTATNEQVPFYGWNADSYTKSQFIIPANELEGMADGIITDLTFYVSASSSDKDLTRDSWDIYLAGTNTTEQGTAYVDFETMTKVYSGTLSVKNHQVTIHLDSPYQYDADSENPHLRVGFNQTAKGDYTRTYWLGTAETNQTTAPYYSRASYGSNNASFNFLPKTTFTYSNPNLHGITVNQPTEGGEIAASAGAALPGTIITLTATPELGYEFGEWIVTPSSVTITGNTFEMPASDVTVTATFNEVTQYGITFVGIDETLITVAATFGGETITEAPAGTEVTLEYSNLNIGYTFGNWTLNGEALAGNTFTMPAEAVEVGVVLNERPRFAVTIDEAITNGTITAEPSSEILGGTLVTLTITPETGYTLDVLTVTDAESNPVAVTNNTFTMPESNVTVTATFVHGITVYDGTDTNDQVPVYGLYADSDYKSQFIFPAEDLEAMAGGIINSMTFYASEEYVAIPGTWSVYVSEVENTTLSGLEDWANLDAVLEGAAITISGHQMTVNFATPFLYNGGNLLIGFKETISGSYTNTTWYGVDQLANTAYFSYSGSYGSSNGPIQFLPKTTFLYTPVTPYTVNLHVNGVVSEEEVSILPTPENIPAGMTFCGWTSTDIATYTTEAPSYVTKATADGEDFYAVFSYTESEPAASKDGETWEKVTDASDLSAGDEIVLVYNNMIMCNREDAAYMDYPVADVTITDNQITSLPTNAAQFTLVANGDYWNLQYEELGETRTLATEESSKELASEDLLESWSYTALVDFEAQTYNNSVIFKNADLDYYIGYYSEWNQITLWTSTYACAAYKKSIPMITTTYYMTEVLTSGEVTNLTTNNIIVASPITISGRLEMNAAGLFRNENVANFVFADSAQFYYTGEETVEATFEKDITGYTGDNDNYYLIANPTDNTTVANLINNSYDLFIFNPAEASEWKNQHDNAVIEQGTGYLYANSEDVTLQFAGELTPAGSTDVTLVYAGAGDGIDFPGFNLIGNPFACNAYVGKPFYVIQGTELTLSKNAYVAPCEGFFVEAAEDDLSVTLSTTVPAPANMMSLSVSQNRGNVIDRAIVRFDGANDLHKFMMNPAHTNIRLAKNGQEFAAVSSDAEGEIPVSFMAEKDGSYTISVNTENVNAHYIHLIDNKTGMDTDLLATPSYTFNASTNDYAYRFKLVFNVEIGEANGNDGDNDNFAFMSNGNLVIDNIEGEAVLQIVDVLGRVLSTEIVSGSYNKALNLKAGLYILNLNGMTQKIVVE